MPIRKQSAHPPRTSGIGIRISEIQTTESEVVLLRTSQDAHRLTADCRVVDERHNYLNSKHISHLWVWELILKRRRADSVDPHAFYDDVA